MVTRASSVPHLNSSGGSSNESAAGSGSSGRKSRLPNSRTRRTGKSVTPTQARSTPGSMPRSRSLTHGMQRVAPQKSSSSSGGVGSRNTPVFLRSRENDSTQYYSHIYGYTRL
ncbi:unnamed protein product [Ceratitis capitata]|uniref:(Mediterranean fruit fly) hypothetical protein n=1 Tax=Ceratitis capitata TaxID=7213 RepID=A0A811VBL9_CERCA|nr:unnamed protein product [Ceratitis capitata]